MTCGTVVTTYVDGTTVEAHPCHDDESQARARALGYVDVYAMTLEHDALHTALARGLGVGRSPVLDGLAHGRTVDAELAHAEECLVLAAQRYLNLARRTPDADA